MRTKLFALVDEAATTFFFFLGRLCLHKLIYLHVTTRKIPFHQLQYLMKPHYKNEKDYYTIFYANCFYI